MDEFTSIPSLPVLDLGNVGRKRVNGELAKDTEERPMMWKGIEESGCPRS